ncbi:MAG: hypothetical protein Q8M94_20645, partial [Ignavibacteria bacterium]|nr:hypothetical protein [Ignavibacteria bacterium]
MKKLFSLLIVSGLLTFSSAADLGMYMLTIKNIQGDYDKVCADVKQSLQSAGFKILADREITTPDRVKKDKKNLCGYKGKLLVFTNDEYVKMLTSFGNKYLAASMLRVGIHETNEGIQVIIADPETINRII